MQEKQPNVIIIDAKGKVLGRLATEVAIILRGKNKPEFVPYKTPDIFVSIYNVGKIKVSGKKFENKIYWRHSGHPGGIKGTRYKDLLVKDPTVMFRKAVWGMLPKNKLRPKMMKRLKLHGGEMNKGNA